MSYSLYSKTIASISELKSNPMATLARAKGDSLAILNRTKPVFYCVPADLYEQMMEKLDDIELIKLIKEREKEQEIAIDIHEL